MIDTEQLVRSLPEQRWYSGRERKLSSIEMLDHAVIEDGGAPLVTAVVQAEFEDGGQDRYNLLLVLHEDGSIRDAFDEVERLRALGLAMAQHMTLRGRNGVFSFAGPGLDPAAALGYKSIRAVESEQSNSSVILDDEIIVKAFRRPGNGPNPDLQLNRWLTSEGFEHVPAQVGEMAYRPGASDSDTDTDATIDLAIAQQWIDGADGWQEVIGHLKRVYDEADPADATEDMPSLVVQRSGRILDQLEELGDVTAALHIALARQENDADFAPQTVRRGDLQAWAEGIEVALQELLQRGVDELAERRPAIDVLLRRFRAIVDAGYMTRIHGDYHLGQVMLAERGWMIIDFEGEPLRPLEARRIKQSPLRDVAGMLRSFNYAVCAGLFERSEPDSDEWRILQPWADAWERVARDRFLRAYFRKSYEGRLLAPDRDALNTMLHVFELDKALYEVGYEISHRPGWVYIPLRGIAQLLAGGGRR
ncbi:MAG: phosphotransferase [Actinomycetota bacterium]|nr:phosphotransferase [Actinomycetota bacterium]